MSLNINTVIVAGHLTRDPVVRALPHDRTVADFSLAINRRFKSADGDQREETTFVDIEVWGRTAEVASEFLVKGSGCLVEGRLRLDSWQDKEGQRRSRLKILGESIHFVGPKPASPRGPGAPTDSAMDPPHLDQDPTAGRVVVGVGVDDALPPF